MIGIEETKWTDKDGKKPKGEHKFFSEKSFIF